MAFDQNLPFNTLPLLPPLRDVESKAVLKATILAKTAITELKNKAAMLPSEAILLNNLTLVEAKDSSEIENIFTTHDKLYEANFLSEKEIDPSTKEVQRYRMALWKGMDLVKERGLNTNSYIEIVQTIKLNSAGIRTTPGTKIVTPTGELIYTPPEGEELLRKLLTNLDAFLNDAPSMPENIHDIDPLIKMAIMHYQFEAIHPFGDGNGRTGRILNILYLVEKGLLVEPILFLSRYIIQNKTGYYKGLQNVTENQDWESWIVYMLKAVETTSYETVSRIDDILAAMKCLASKLKTETKIYTKDLVEEVFKSPITTITMLEQAGIAKRATAANYLKILESMGVMERKKIGNSVIYINKALYNILKK